MTRALEPDGDVALVEAARRGDEGAFGSLVERHRPALHAHCYRMLASPHDADEAVQEALLRAWKAIARFEGRSSVRTWLFKIATRTSLDLVRSRGRRELPVGTSPPARAGESPGLPRHDIVWMGPFAAPKEMPETSYLERESIEVAYVAALQYLPARQRAMFLLREILGFHADEVAEMLGTTVAAVNSGLQRARAELERRRPAGSQREELARLGDAEVQELARRYARAIESADLPSLLALLTADASWSMPPLPGWFDGQEAVASFLSGYVFPQRWRHVTTRANGQLAVGCYLFDAHAGCFLAAALDVLALRDGRISSVTGFLTAAGAGAADPAVVSTFARFGLPDRLAD